jgi:hypothetical protein
MAELPKRLLISVDPDPGPDADAELREETARRLQGVLTEVDVDSVQQVREAAAPAGAKGDPVSLGSLLVTLAASGGVLTTLIGAVQSWLTRSERCSVTMEIDGDKITLTGASSEEQRRLATAFIKRHAAPAKGAKA